MIQSSSDNKQFVTSDKEECNMNYSVNEPSIFRTVIIALTLTIALSLVLAPDMALAKRGGDDDNRSEF